MNANTKISEKIAILATLNPASVAPGTVVTTFVPMALFGSVAALVQLGALGAGATVDAKLRQATDATGTGAKDIPGKAIAQIVKASGDNTQAIIECRAEDLDTNSGFNFVALSVTVGTAASLVGASLIGGNGRFYPASSYNQTAVVQVI